MKLLAMLITFVVFDVSWAKDPIQSTLTIRGKIDPTLKIWMEVYYESNRKAPSCGKMDLSFEGFFSWQKNGRMEDFIMQRKADNTYELKGEIKHGKFDFCRYTLSRVRFMVRPVKLIPNTSPRFMTYEIFLVDDPMVKAELKDVHFLDCKVIKVKNEHQLNCGHTYTKPGAHGAVSHGTTLFYPFHQEINQEFNLDIQSIE